MIDLAHIERYHENNRIEAKKAAGGFPHSLWETYSAFANTIGGLILLGVEESRKKALTITGIPTPQAYLDIFWHTVHDPTQVSANILQPEQVFLQTVEEKQVMVIQVPRADRHDRPLYIGDSPFTGSYRRDGEGDYHCSPEEVRAMLRDRDDAPADLALLDSCTPQDLSMETLRQYRLLLAMRAPEHPWNYLPDAQFLPAAGLVGTDPGGRCHPTVAGLLLLGQREKLRQIFPGYRLEYRESDTSFVLSSRDPGWAGNLFSFYDLVSQRLSAAAALLGQTPEERRNLAAALREAVLNAILHADYLGREGLSIERTAAAIQVINSGLLRVPPDTAQKGGTADPRNMVLTRLFSLIRAASGTGRGLKGIYTLWAQQGWNPPVLSESFRSGTTRLSLPLPPRSLSPADLLRQQIVEYLTDHVSASLEDLTSALVAPGPALQAGLDRLQKEALILSQDCPNGPIYRLRA